MNRVATLRLLFALALALSAAGPAGAVPDARLTVSNVAVAPGTPLVGETVTVTATVRNSVGSPSPVEIERIELREGDAVLDRAERVGSLSPGDDLSVPLTAAFDGAGVRTLELRVVGVDADGDEVSVARPVPIAVEDAAPRLELAVPSPAVDAETPVRVTVSNPSETPVRNLVVRFDDPLGEPGIDRRAIPVLGPGATATVNLTAVPDAEGEQPVRVALDYATEAGTESTTAAERTVSVAPFVDDVGVEVRPEAPRATEGPTDAAGSLGGLLSGAGSAAGVTDGGQAEGDAPTTRYEVVVTNFGTVPVENVVVTPRAGDTALPRERIDGPLAPGERATATVDLADVREPTEVRFALAYDAGVRAGSAEAGFEYRPPVGEIRITDANVTARDDGTVAVTANAANVGRGEVTGLVAEVVPTEAVRPTYPQRDYFVGTVDGSDFAPFELTARVDDGAETIPVRLTYQVDGVDRQRVVDLPYEPPRERSGGGFSLGSAGAGAAASAGLTLGALALAAVLLARRERR
ncbi:COG1361 family protein [Halegenticoccus soli]|uniref:hypothetical protein n=1 Tax=Halegenticoccus soli TaxID=1985678 RepID=UPI000C6DE78A|nr:hypothetical protein [Halegenticoccus soli]